MPNFPDPPSRRLAYDTDGSVATLYNEGTGAISEVSTGDKQAMNDESTSNYNVNLGGGIHTFHLNLYFPGLRDITDIFLSTTLSGATLLGVEYSANSTNPLDGTWTGVAITPLTNAAVVPEYRTAIAGWVASGVKAIRVRYTLSGGNPNIGFYAFHIYGTRAAGDTSRQCALVTAGGVRLAKDFDFQDQPRGSTYKWKSGTLFNQASELYVKNFGATTANNVIVGQGALTGAMHNNIRLSLDDSTYTQTLTATTIAAGASYGPIFMRWTPPSNDTLGLQTMRTSVTVGSWS